MVVHGWKGKKGELLCFSHVKLWRFNSNDGREICVRTLRNTEKGCMTQIVLEDFHNKKEVFFEILEKDFNQKIVASSMAQDETLVTIMNLCETVLSVDTSISEFNMSSSLYPCAEILIEQFFGNAKEIHVYYGNGFFFGVKRSRDNKKMDLIPKRVLEIPTY